jgi:uncharacterized membrane protein YvlD (DUF360 family)
MLELSAIIVGVVTLVVAFAVAARFVPGIEYEGLLGLLMAAILYKALTLGIFFAWPSLSAAIGPDTFRNFYMIGSVLLWAALFWLVGQVVPGFKVRGVGSAILGSLVISAVQVVVGVFQLGTLITRIFLGGEVL